MDYKVNSTRAGYCRFMRLRLVFGASNKESRENVIKARDELSVIKVKFMGILVARKEY